MRDKGAILLLLRILLNQLYKLFYSSQLITENSQQIVVSAASLTTVLVAFLLRQHGQRPKEQAKTRYRKVL